MSSNHRLVYSTDPKDQAKLQPKKVEPVVVNLNQVTVIFRIEKNGRGGKTVTVLAGWPRHETFLKELSKEMKAKCGVGGTYRIESDGGVIEIQGDQREKLKALLQAKQIKYKGM